MAAFRRNQRSRSRGLSLAEVAVSMAVFTILVVSVFSIAAETSKFIGDTDMDYSVHAEVNRAYMRLAETLRKSGWNESAGTTFPRVTADGTMLVFRLLADLDGNGYSFDAVTGEREWGARVYSVRLDTNTNTLSIYEGTTPVWVLGRHIESVSFSTYLEDNSLHLNEIQMTIASAQTNRAGHVIQHASTSSIYMRN